MIYFGDRESIEEGEREEMRQALFEEDLDRTNPRCPECDFRMIKRTEDYHLNQQYEDEWFECIECGHCQEI